MIVKCQKCGKKYDSDMYSYICPKCCAYYRANNPNDSTIDIENDPRFKDTNPQSSHKHPGGRGEFGNCDNEPYRVSKPNVDYDMHGKIEVNKDYSEKRPKEQFDYTAEAYARIFKMIIFGVVIFVIILTIVIFLDIMNETDNLFDFNNSGWVDDSHFDNLDFYNFNN